MDRPTKTINEIVRGKAAITPETAIQLERALGVAARFWINLETAYREHLARDQAERELERNAGWVTRFPVRDLARHGLVRGGGEKSQVLADLLVFFRVSSPSAWERHWLQPSASLRASRAFTSSPESAAAWLRWGEIEASKIRCRPFDSKGLRRTLAQIRLLTPKEPLSVTLSHMRESLAECGVALVLTPELEGARLSGAARWLGSDKALIQLSLRYKSDDQLWFSLFHEAGHLLSSGRRRDSVDGPEEDRADRREGEEEDADRFARHGLIPPKDFGKLIEQGDFTAAAVRAFARQQGIAPGIVVGRLQREGIIPHSQLNGLKKRLRWG